MSAGELQYQCDGDLYIKGLGQKASHARSLCPLLLFLERAGGQCHHRQAGASRLTPNCLRGLIAIHDRHLHVHQHNIHALGMVGQPVDRRAAIVRQHDVAAFAGKDAPCNLAIDLAVVHDQQAQSSQALARRNRSRHCASQGRTTGLGDGVAKRRRRHRFVQHRVGKPAVDCAQQRRPVLPAHQDHDGKLSRLQRLVQAADRRQSVHVLHLCVDQQHPGRCVGSPCRSVREGGPA